ncbi:MAG: flagellar biosynthesis protein FlhF [Steroidobacter sp.]
MKIKHYRAPDMRQALRQVREAQGPDAVILSSRRISGGVEVVAAVDYDAEASVEQGYGQQVADENRSPLTRTAHDLSHRRGEEQIAESWTTGVQHSSLSPRAEGLAQPASRAPHAAHDYAALAKRLSQSNDIDPPDARSDMNEELRTLRRMLETQLATLAWNDLSRRAPVQTELLKQLTVLGLAHDLAGELVAQLPARLELSEAHRLALALIARRIETTEERWINAGGMVAMIGATGVGKTTLIAKLAARWVLRHGPRDLALISTDSVRIGAQEQIHTLGRLLGVPAYAVDGAGELPALLEHLSERRLVLIDTAGLSQRDPRLGEELDLLSSASSRLETSLVLSAAAQAGAIEEAVERFAAAKPASCMLTKLDEATSLGGALSTLIRVKLPLAYVSDGQRVPEDLSPARAHQLIARAVELSRKSGATADEDLLRRRFGAVAHALA